MAVICLCEAVDDWTPSDGTVSLDAVDFKEGAASIKLTGLGSVPNTVEVVYDPTGFWDWDAFDHLVFWFKASEITSLKFRVWSGANAGVDFVEWERQFLQQVRAVDGWYKVKLYKDDRDTIGGTINWAAVKALRIQLSQTVEFIIYRIDEILIMLADPIKAKIGAVAGLDYVSDDVDELDIWGDDLKVGRWQLLLHNVDNKYGGRFHSNEASDIEINAVTMMKGYVDDVFPHLDEQGYYTNMLEVVGRDYGRDLARLMYSGGFVDTKADDLIETILLAKGSEITYDNPSSANPVTIERTRTYLIDWLQSIAGRTNINRSAYVNQAKALKFFAAGSESSGVALKSVEGALDNNILPGGLLKGEEIGFSIANDIVLSAGSLIDHYSDGNPEDFSVGAGVYPPEACSDAGYYKAGISSIKFGSLASNTLIIIYLDFSGTLYNYDHFDLSDPQECFFIIKPVCSQVGSNWVNARPWLEDGAGCRIEFKRPGNIPFLSAKGKTEDLTEGVGDENWHKVTFTVGDIDVKNTRRDNKWGKIAGSLPFDWTDVVKIGINVITPPAWGPVDLYLDALTIPNIEVIAQIADATSDTKYGTSEWFEQRNDIKSVKELIAAAEAELEKRKDPLKNIRIIATGQTGIKYPGQTATVEAPKHGLTSPTTYRIVSYHHQYRKNPIKGAHSFITTLDLVSHELSPTTQFIDPLRYRLSRDPMGTALEILAQTRRRVRTSQTTQRKDYGDTQPVTKIFFSGSGTAFPTDPDDGFTFRLTADIPSTHLAGFYQYDEGTTSWIRQSQVFRRATNPTYGQVEGDINENTTDGKIYQWTGATWAFIGTKSHDDLDDVSSADHHSPFTVGDHAGIEHLASMMAIEQRKWTSNFNVSWDGADYDKLYYGKAGAESSTDADISFTGGPEDQINQQTEDGVPDGLWYLYWDENFKTGDDYDVKRTDDILVAVGVGKGLLATVLVDEAGSNPPCVQPWGGYTPTVSAGMMAARFIVAGMLKADFVIGDLEIKTGAGVQWDPGGDPGVIITDLGIRGKGAAGALMIQMLASTGKLIAGGAVLDSAGLTLNAQAAWFYDNALLRGQMYAVYNEFSDDLLNIAAPNATLRMVSGLDLILGPGSHYVLPEDPLDKFGKSSDRWDEGWFDDVYGTIHDYRIMYVGDETPKNVVGSVSTEIKTFRIIRDDSHGIRPTTLYIVGEAYVSGGTGYLKVSVNGGGEQTVWTFTNTGSYAHKAGSIALSLSDDTINTISIRLDNSGANTTYNRTLEAYVKCA